MEKLNITPTSEIVEEVRGKVETPECGEMDVSLRDNLKTNFVGDVMQKVKHRIYLCFFRDMLEGEALVKY